MSLPLPDKLNPGQCVTVPVDIQQHKDYPPTVLCAPVDAAAVTDDRATICRGTTQDGKDMYSVHFKSELAGPFGAGVSRDYVSWSNEKNWFLSPFKVIGMMRAKLAAPESYSRYAFQVTPDTISLVDRASPASKPPVTYAVDSLDRAALAVSSAFACWGYHAEDTELLRFANTLNATKLAIPGIPLPTRDRIDQQKGEYPAQRDFTALAHQPIFNDIPLVGGVDVGPTFPLLPKIDKPIIVAVDVKANDLFPANLNFAPLNADVVTNDRALLWSPGQWSDEDKLCARFKSEAGGPLGGLGVAQNLPDVDANKEEYSPYALCINSARQVYALGVSGNRRFKVDLPDRATLFLAGALGALAYSRSDFNLKHTADALYAARTSITSVGDELPAQDRLQAQTKGVIASNNYYLEHAEMLADLCRPSSPNYSTWKCIGAGMDVPGGW